ncbi:MAG: alpha/beta hydrolase [Deltaproteobacteria bacterium]|nr:alpha/beta hydrolase [Deltaproteobacteria bacterium]
MIHNSNQKNAQFVSIPLTRSNTGRTTDGRLYGASDQAVIFSNMDTNNRSEWEPVVEHMSSEGYMLLTYDYIQYEDDQSEILEDAISFVKALGSKKIVLIGASRGGVASVKVATRSADNDCMAGVAALSAPIEHEGIVFYSDDELKKNRIPKLLISSESDDGADDTRKMYELFDDPKEVLFYPGNAHGTELFGEQQESLVRKLNDFTVSVFTDRS